MLKVRQIGTVPCLTMTVKKKRRGRKMNISFENTARDMIRITITTDNDAVKRRKKERKEKEF